MNIKSMSYFQVSENLFIPVNEEYVNQSLIVKSDKMPIVEASCNGGLSCCGPRVFASGDYHLIDCSHCGFIHVTPPPSEMELSDFYRKKFYNQKRKKEYFDKQKAQLDWWNSIFDQRLQRLEHLLGRKGFILDVGCGPGFFLKHARDAGWEVIGLEPSEDAVNYARQELSLPILQDEIDTFLSNGLGRPVDVIYSHGVIEHLRNPISYLEKSKAILGGSGLIFTSAANDFSIYQALAVKSLGINPWWIIPPEHLNYFSVESLVSVHERFGYKTRDLRTSFPIDLFLLMGEDYVSHPDLGSKFHSMRANYETIVQSFGFSNLLSEIEESNARMGIGRQAEIIAEVS